MFHLEPQFAFKLLSGAYSFLRRLFRRKHQRQPRVLGITETHTALSLGFLRFDHSRRTATIPVEAILPKGEPSINNETKCKHQSKNSSQLPSGNTISAKAKVGSHSKRAIIASASSPMLQHSKTTTKGNRQ